MARCPDCKRPKASEADWAAFRGIDCNEDNCAWGADRCWYSDGCGFTARAVQGIATRGKALRAGRRLTPQMHDEAHAADTERRNQT